MFLCNKRESNGCSETSRHGWAGGVRGTLAAHVEVGRINPLDNSPTPTKLWNRVFRRRVGSPSHRLLNHTYFPG
ncbi:hypothetical protein RJ55_05234 [Drechmeria coniospora]|nr:hypothetical protein RJ55_05234 [Drechmeria coniospora]